MLFGDEKDSSMRGYISRRDVIVGDEGRNQGQCRVLCLQGAEHCGRWRDDI